MALFLLLSGKVCILPSVGQVWTEYHTTSHSIQCPLWLWPSWAAEAKLIVMRVLKGSQVGQERHESQAGETRSMWENLGQAYLVKCACWPGLISQACFWSCAWDNLQSAEHKCREYYLTRAATRYREQRPPCHSKFFWIWYSLGLVSS